MKEIQLEGLNITMERRDVKNLNLYVKPPDGRILVTVPRRMKEERVLEFLQSRVEWMKKARERVLERADRIEASERTPTREETEALKTAVLAYAAKWEPVMGVHGSQWQIRNMKTRWGSCSVHSGKIRINLRLAVRPRECLEYVIVHELCHLLEPSHNQKFRALMDAFLPDWRERKRKLEEGTV